MTYKKTASEQVDELMESASQSLVRRDYFAAERSCVAALGMAIAAHDYQRAARIVMPLQECRRQKRDLAVDSGRIEVVVEPIDPVAPVKPGCYLLCPPRVAQEARQWRESADAAGVPVLVLAREPATRAGLVPIVTVGACTVRAYVTEPEDRSVPNGHTEAHKPGKQKKIRPPTAVTNAFGRFNVPSVSWMLAASEALGDAAIAQCAGGGVDARDHVEELWLRLQSFPDHEKLHQRLMEACEHAARQPAPTAPRTRAIKADDDDDNAD